MKYELAVFDMDGTILNTLEDLADSLNHVLEKSGYPRRSIQEVKSFVGNGIRRLIERGVPKGTDEASVDKVYQEFIEYYQVHCADKTRPYDGVMELLKTLREAGCLTAVVSNKADSAVQELCRQYFDGLFDIAVGDRAGFLRKPSPDSVNEVLGQLKMKREKAVYIGDSDVDIDTAGNAGMDSIIVTWGFREKEFLKEHGADMMVSQPREIAEIILS